MAKAQSATPRSKLPIVIGILALAGVTAGIWMMSNERSTELISSSIVAGNSETSPTKPAGTVGPITVMPAEVSTFGKRFGGASAALLNGREISILSGPVFSIDTGSELWIGSDETDRILIRVPNSSKLDLAPGDFVNLRGIVRAPSTETKDDADTQSVPQAFIQVSEWEKTDGRSNYQM